MSSIDGYVKIKKAKNGISEIEFFHPQSNSLPSNLLRELTDAITRLGSDENTNVIILKSGGDRTFCAGASFNELSSISTIDEGIDFFSGFANVINAARKCPKLIIGRVQGKAVGGGVGMASAVDYCFATKYASIKLSELAIGIGPFVVGPAVERKIGISAMSSLAINATKWFDSNWALEKGLYTELFETSKEMDEHINQLALKINNSHQKATTSLKRIFWEGTDHWDKLLKERAEISGKLILSEFSKKTISTILKK